MGVHIRRQAQIIHANSIHRLQPDRLPDARTGRVKNPLGLARLFAARLVALGGVYHRNADFLLAGPLQTVGDVEAEGIRAATKLGDFFCHLLIKHTRASPPPPVCPPPPPALENVPDTTARCSHPAAASRRTRPIRWERAPGFARQNW